MWHDVVSLHEYFMLNDCGELVFHQMIDHHKSGIQKGKMREVPPESWCCIKVPHIIFKGNKKTTDYMQS